MSYQETMQRRRKYSVQSKSMDIPVRAFAFDLLYLNGNSLINIDTEKRIEMLEKNIKSSKEGSIALAESKKVSSKKEIKKYFKECIKNGLEGIIVKEIKGGYKPGIGNYEWVKIKKSIDKKLVDTIDMVVVGYYKRFWKKILSWCWCNSWCCLK
jgi:DNA ligase-1